MKLLSSLAILMPFQLITLKSIQHRIYNIIFHSKGSMVVKMSLESGNLALLSFHHLLDM